MPPDYLTSRSVAVLRFDNRGVGQSMGIYANATTADLATDARAAMAYLRTRPLVAAQRVGLLGHDEGTNVALLATAGPSRHPAFVMALAGYGQSGHEVLRRQQGEIMRLIGADPTQMKAAQDVYLRTVEIIRQTPDNTLARTKVAALLSGTNTGLDAGMARARAVQLTTPWSRYFFDFDPQTQLSKVQCPVLLLNGTADLQVSPRRDMAPLQRALRHAHCEVTAHRLAGVNHLFHPAPAQWPLVNGVQQATFSPEALQKIYDWVAVETTPPGAPLPLVTKQLAPPRKAAKTTSAPRG